MKDSLQIKLTPFYMFVHSPQHLGQKSFGFLGGFFKNENWTSVGQKNTYFKHHNTKYIHFFKASKTEVIFFQADSSENKQYNELHCQ